MASIRLPLSLQVELLRQARSEPRREICGLISALRGRARTCYPITNVARDPSGRYDMDPGELIDAMRRMREAGEQLLAIYHSHPAGPAYPSITDVREATYPKAVYLVVSLQDPQAPLRGFRLRPGEAPREVEVIIEDAGG